MDKVEKKVKFKTFYNFVLPKQNTGDGREKIYHYTEDKNGSKILVEDGTSNFYDLIQSHKDECDLQVILAKYVQTGDISLLQQREGFYADVSELPKDMQELNMHLRKTMDTFSTFPADFREKFSNDVYKFISSIKNGSFEDIYQNYLSSKNKFNNLSEQPLQENLKGDEQNVEAS